MPRRSRAWWLIYARVAPLCRSQQEAAELADQIVDELEDCDYLKQKALRERP